mmetsp:Transcript_27487/g.64138  ORF Transcript_27487/g.64138 Transcript_27487/m.64138 type:complete len:457 (-) Transcript_27487:802-2172(-)
MSVLFLGGLLDGRLGVDHLDEHLDKHQPALRLGPLECGRRLRHLRHVGCGQARVHHGAHVLEERVEGQHRQRARRAAVVHVLQMANGSRVLLERKASVGTHELQQLGLLRVLVEPRLVEQLLRHGERALGVRQQQLLRSIRLRAAPDEGHRPALPRRDGPLRVGAAHGRAGRQSRVGRAQLVGGLQEGELERRARVRRRLVEGGRLGWLRARVDGEMALPHEPLPELVRHEVGRLVDVDGADVGLVDAAARERLVQNFEQPVESLALQHLALATRLGRQPVLAQRRLQPLGVREEQLPHHVPLRMLAAPVSLRVVRGQLPPSRLHKELVREGGPCLLVAQSLGHAPLEVEILERAQREVALLRREHVSPQRLVERLVARLVTRAAAAVARFDGAWPTRAVHQRAGAVDLIALHAVRLLVDGGTIARHSTGAEHAHTRCGMHRRGRAHQACRLVVGS